MNDRMALLGIERVLSRGTGEVIEDRPGALFVHDTVSGAYFLACGDAAAGLSVLDRHMNRGIDLLMVSDAALGRTAFERYGFAETFECYQVAYYGAPPAVDTRLRVRETENRDLPLLTKYYHMISPEEMARVVARRSLLMGYDGERLIGFIGEHLEGSMGMLYILPEFRRRGFAVELEKHYIARTMSKGLIPFGQVEKHNEASLRLQRKLGLIQSEKTHAWMWR